MMVAIAATGYTRLLILLFALLLPSSYAGSPYKPDNRHWCRSKDKSAGVVNGKCHVEWGQDTHLDDKDFNIRVYNSRCDLLSNSTASSLRRDFKHNTRYGLKMWPGKSLNILQLENFWEAPGAPMTYCFWGKCYETTVLDPSANCVCKVDETGRTLCENNLEWCCSCAFDCGISPPISTQHAAIGAEMGVLDPVHDALELNNSTQNGSSEIFQ